ncbi:MAG TPA: serine--tRNA ligase, partial [Thermoanaerobaculia bacterium]
EAVTRLEEKRRRRNELTAGKGKPSPETLAEMRTLKEEIHQLERVTEEAEQKLNEVERVVPNAPKDDVPRGKDESANRVERTSGEPPSFAFTPQPHWDLGVALDVLDFDRAAKITGARFTVLKGAAARLSRALIQMFLDFLVEENGYREVLPPFMVNADSLFGTGQLPKFAQDLFQTGDGYYLVPTAEVPVTNLYRDEILKAEELPLRYAAYTPCFRAEAGAAGRDTRGMIRQHQFDKVEMVWFVRPEDSDAALEKLTSHPEELLRRLRLPFRRISLCTGDLGFASAKTYDLEVWLPSQNAYREISSCSNYADFQARRASIRFRRREGEKPEFVHTLNGSCLPIGRTIVAILENHQRADGSVEIPEALRPYMGGLAAIERT